MKSIFCFFLLVVSLNHIYGQKFYGTASPAFSIKLGEQQDTLSLKAKIKYGVIELIVPEETRSVLISRNERFTLITSGTDVVGSIQFYDNEKKAYVYNAAYAGEEPIWAGDIVKFESVEWSGEGFTVRRWITFNDGVVIKGKQYIGDYHGSGEDKVDPLCPNYKLASYGNNNEIIKYSKSRMDYISKDFPEKYKELSKKLQDFGFSYEKIDELYQGIIGLLEANKKSIKEHWYFTEVFSGMYIILDKAYEKGIIRKDDMNKKVKTFLQNMDIDVSIAKWLIK